MPAGWADQVQEKADRRCLARTVGPEEAEHLAALDLKVKRLDPSTLTIELGQAVNLWPPRGWRWYSPHGPYSVESAAPPATDRSSGRGDPGAAPRGTTITGQGAVRITSLETLPSKVRRAGP